MARIGPPPESDLVERLTRYRCRLAAHGGREIAVAELDRAIDEARAELAGHGDPAARARTERAPDRKRPEAG
jgi:hypothetical protein